MSDPSVPPQERLELPPGSESVAPAPSTSPSEQPLAYRVVRGGLVVAVASYATIVIGFAATIVMARLLPPADFGTLAIATFLFGVVNLRTKIGIGQAFVHQSETTERSKGTLLTLDVGSGFISLLLALIAVPVLRFLGYQDQVTLVVLGLALVGLLDAGAGTPGVLLDKNLRFGRTTVLTAITLALSYLPTFYLALHGWGVWSLVAQAALQTLLNVLGLWWLVRHDLGEPLWVRWTFDRTLAKDMLRFGVVAGSALIGGFLVSQFDNFLVGTFVGLAALGFYDRAYRFASWPNLLVSNVVARTSFYAYARLQDDRARLSKTLEMTLWIITSLALPLALVIFVTAPDLIAFLIGDQWLPAAVLLRFLVVFSLIRPLQDDIGGLLIAIGKPHLVSVSAWVETGMLLVAATALTFPFGAVGTAVGVGIAFIVGCGLYYYWVAKDVDIAWGHALGLPLLVTLVTLASYYFVNQWFDWKDLPLFIRLCLKTAFTSSTFYGLMITTQPRIFLKRTRYILALTRG
ncbi:MAG: oligosaccharide flippase family protein [Chloroflexi bacterium]|nr:oligosaccharide flippase family protein [Chloroflexota bacterium]